MMALQCELLEQRFALNDGGEATKEQIETYQRTTNTLRRTLESLGLERQARDVTPPGMTIDNLIDGVVKQSRQARTL